MLRLSSQLRSASRAPFICTTCRALLSSGATRLPGAVAKLCVARHYYSTEQQQNHQPDKQPAQQPDQRPAQQPDQQPSQQPDSQSPATSKSPRRFSSTPRGIRQRAARHRKKLAAMSEAASEPSDPPDPSVSTSHLWRETLKALQDSQSPPREGLEPPESHDEKGYSNALDLLQKALGNELSDRPETDTGTAKHALDMLRAMAQADPGANPMAKASSATTAPKGAEVEEKRVYQGPLRRPLADLLGLELATGVPTEGETPAEPASETPATKTAKATKATKPKPKPPASAQSQPESQPKVQLSKKTLEALQPLKSITRKTKKQVSNFVVNRIDPRKLQLTPIEKPQPPVPKLAYGLDRVLFNPGVYHIQDPRSRVYNFDPYLERIMPVKDFDFNAIKQYITSSKDTTLIETAAEYGMKYTGSTSSMTSTLAHFHYLVSAWRPINPEVVSQGFDIESKRFTRLMRAPSATFLHWKDGVYAIDADKEFDSANILSMLGKSMEKLLTLPKEEFEKYRKTNSDQLTDEDRNGPEAFHYTTLGDFMMRSQLDAYDPRLPGSGMFDLKTRAVISIRMDARDFYKGLGYEIRGRFGQWESFEREYFDMIRAAFLKYSLQVRMGRMDGIFVAFHNTERIFGFQYIPLQEMDLALHGQTDLTLGDKEFKVSVHLLNKVLDKATAKFPGRSLRLHFETRGEESTPFMYVFAKPVTPTEIEKIQGARRAQIEEFESRMMGIVKEEARALEEEDGAEEAVEEPEDDVDVDEDEGALTNSAAWADVMAKVEDALEDEEHGMTFVREAVENALRESELLRSTSQDEDQRRIDAFFEALTSSTRPAERGSTRAAEERAQEEEEEAEEAIEEDAEEEAEELVEEEQAKEKPTETGGAERQVEEHVEKPVGKQAGNQAEVPIEEQLEIIVEDQATEQDEVLAEEKSREQLEESSDEPQGKAQSPAAEGSSVSEPSLKDLLVKLAAQIRATPSEKRLSLIEEDEAPEAQTPAHALKLRKIEKLLSELAEWDDADQGEGNKVLEKGSVSSELEEVVEPAEAAEETEPASDEAAATTPKAAPAAKRDVDDVSDNAELYGLVLTIRNKVNGDYVVRPENLSPRHRWLVEYAIEEVRPERAHTLYRMLLKRRKTLLNSLEGGDPGRWHGMFRGQLEKFSVAGRKFRQRENQRQSQQPVHVYGSDEPLTYDEAFPGCRWTNRTGKKKWD